MGPPKYIMLSVKKDHSELWNTLYVNWNTYTHTICKQYVQTDTSTLSTLEYLSPVRGKRGKGVGHGDKRE